MYTRKPYPGKFEGNSSQLLAQVVYNASLDGGNEELGDVEGFGYYSYVRGKRYHYILQEDSQGFVYVIYGSPKDMQAKWSAIEAEYEAWGSEQGEED